MTRQELESLTVVRAGAGAALVNSAGMVDTFPDRDAAYAEVRRLRRNDGALRRDVAAGADLTGGSALLAAATLAALTCPECGEDVWDGPSGSKLAKCWNAEGHASGRTIAFATLDDDEEAAAAS